MLRLFLPILLLVLACGAEPPPTPTPVPPTPTPAPTVAPSPTVATEVPDLDRADAAIREWVEANHEKMADAIARHLAEDPPFAEGVLALLGDTSVSADFYVGSIVETMTVTIQPVAVIELPTVGSRVVVSAESPLPNDAGTVSATVPFLVLYNAETEAVTLQDEAEEGEYQVAVNADNTGEAIKGLLGK